MPKPRAASDKVLAVMIDSEVIRRIRQHARTHEASEVCGVLIGSGHDGSIRVTECIPGENAAQAGTHVTFTQETWAHVYKVKDAQFPDSRIIGWYHSHPGFGVFLSDHDAFIHKNFFSSSDQIAWVYDPHTDEEGCFGWVSGHIQRIDSIKVADRRGGEKVEGSLRAEPVVSADTRRPNEGIQIRYSEDDRGDSPKIHWAFTILTHLCAVMIGLMLAWFVLPRVVVIPVPVDPRTGQPIASPSVNGDSASSPQAPAPAPKPQSGEGRNGK